MQNLEWTKQTTTYDYLKSQAKGEKKPSSMVAWLRLIGVIPMTTEWKRGNRLPNTNLKPNAIPAGYLAEVAHDWDAEGRTTPQEFIDALAFEVLGTPEKESVASVQNELTMEALAWSDSSPDSQRA